VKIHLDTDLGGDPDDGCALALLLGWPGVDGAAFTRAWLAAVAVAGGHR
jgi:hypothetical protein